MKQGFTYILSNTHRNVLYIGVTSDLETRVLQHKTGQGSKFTTKYNCTELMYFETFPLIEQAIESEKQLKRWHRDWKWNLIKEANPDLLDLAADWFDKETLKQVQGDD